MSFRGHLGVTLGSFWDHSSIWGSFRDHLGIISISFWDHFGICFRFGISFLHLASVWYRLGISLVIFKSFLDLFSIWHHFGMIWVSLWDHFGIILRSFWHFAYVEIIWGSLWYHFRFFWGPRAAGIWGRGSVCCWNLGYLPPPFIGRSPIYRCWNLTALQVTDDFVYSDRYTYR